MDLSWCIICDRHCTDNNLYCSDLCRFQDNNADTYSSEQSYPSNKRSTSLITPPASPSFQAFHSFHTHNHGSSRSTTARNLTHVSNDQYFPYRFTPGSPNEISLITDDT